MNDSIYAFSQGLPGLMNSVPAFRELIIQPAWDLATPSPTSLIMVDVLDEAIAWQDKTIVDVLAEQAENLPPWLRIVATTRPESEVLARVDGLSTFLLAAERCDNIHDDAGLGGLLRRPFQKAVARCGCLYAGLCDHPGAFDGSPGTGSLPGVVPSRRGVSGGPESPSTTGGRTRWSVP